MSIARGYNGYAERASNADYEAAFDALADGQQGMYAVEIWRNNAFPIRVRITVANVQPHPFTVEFKLGNNDIHRYDPAKRNSEARIVKIEVAYGTGLPVPAVSWRRVR
jgi:hypothetical protein